MSENSSSNISLLLKKAVASIRAGEWNQATLFCNKVLSINPDNSRAYLGKLMADLHVKDSEELRNLKEPFDENENYLKICKLDQSLGAKLDQYNEAIYMKIAESYYNYALNQMKTASTEQEYKQAAQLFDDISGYKDSDSNREKCLELANRNKLSLSNTSFYNSQSSLPSNKYIPNNFENSDEDSSSKQKKGSGLTIAIIIASVVVLVLAGFLVLPLIRENKIVSIEAKYDGSFEQGTVLDSSNDGFTITGKTEDGDEIIINQGKWTIENPKTLVADTSSDVIIHFKDYQYLINIPCTTSLVDYLTVTYDGPTTAGTVVVPSEDSHVVVSATYVNGETKDIKGEVKFSNDSYPFEKDSSINIEDTYLDPNSNNEVVGSLEIKCSDRTVDHINAKYTGNTEAGTVLDNNNDGITVTGTYKDGESETLLGWKIAEPTTLSPSSSSTVTISYEDCTCDLTVKCSTEDPAIYKSQCISVSVDELLRNPDIYRGTKIKISGKITQVLSGSNYGSISSSNSGYTISNCASYGLHPFSNSSFLCRSGWDYFYVRNHDTTCGNLIEDDKVTIYGEAEGTYSYTTVLGAKKTVPKIIAQYIVR